MLPGVLLRSQRGSQSKDFWVFITTNKKTNKLEGWVFETQERKKSLGPPRAAHLPHSSLKRARLWGVHWHRIVWRLIGWTLAARRWRGYSPELPRAARSRPNQGQMWMSIFCDLRQPQFDFFSHMPSHIYIFIYIYIYIYIYVYMYMYIHIPHQIDSTFVKRQDPGKSSCQFC